MAPQRGVGVFSRVVRLLITDNWIRLYLCSGEFSVLLDQQQQTQFYRHCSSHRRTTICPLSLQTEKKQYYALIMDSWNSAAGFGYGWTIFALTVLVFGILLPRDSLKPIAHGCVKEVHCLVLQIDPKTLLRTFSMNSLTISFGIPTHACWIPIQWLGICPQAYHLIQVLDCFESSTHTIHLLSTQSLPFHLTVSYLAAI